MVKLYDGHFTDYIKNAFDEFLNDKNVNLGQKLFVLNIYLENLDTFGMFLNDCVKKKS